LHGRNIQDRMFVHSVFVVKITHAKLRMRGMA
jgi:hypothetical protein